MTDELRQRIQSLVATHKIVIFMKGTKVFPMCGFSASAVAVFHELGVPFETVNILEDPELREGIKEFSNWPTIPQVYLAGKFVGGADIVREMYESGELQPLVQSALAA
ncbi:MAG: Grx4 family monothiol glutaredoxin [Deltaproteobacteria bacterium]|nr:Grx4 family monothiol glutaredoxin [Deltaproteobacteria bacterium]